ncbi:23251_t:CDS:2, partial [Racocetra persica]
MTKEKLQKEILEKVKPGTKPSDLKKKRGNTTQFTHGIPTPPPSPVLKPTKTNNLKELQQQANEKIRKLEQKNDPEHILEKHNPYKEKVKELETKIHEQYKTIEDLKKQ